MLIGLVLIGKTINLTSDDININSTNFKVDKNGNMTCSNANITDGKITLGSPLSGEGNAILQLYENYTNSYIELYPNNFEMRREAPFSSISFGLGGRYVDENGNDAIDGSVYFLIGEEDGSELKGGPSGFNMWGPGGSGGTYVGYSGVVTPQVQIRENETTWAGYVMYGKQTGHKYRCHWTGSQLQFWVDETNVGTLSDARLKTEIQDIDEDFIKAIKEIEMKQFKVANRNGLVSFGILAQDLIEIFKKYNKNPFDYEIVQETEYRTDDDTIYYTINYEQYLILKTKAQEIELQNQQETIENLLKRIERLEEKNGIN